LRLKPTASKYYQNRETLEHRKGTPQRMRIVKRIISKTRCRVCKNIARKKRV